MKFFDRLLRRLSQKQLARAALKVPVGIKASTIPEEEIWDDPEFTMDLDTRPLCARPESYDRPGLDALIALEMLKYKPLPEVTAEQVDAYAGPVTEEERIWRRQNPNPYHITPEEWVASTKRSV